MSDFTRKANIINTAYNKLLNCLDDVDLRKLKLTLAEYRICQSLMLELGDPRGSATKTVSKAAAEFFKSCGFNVEDKGVNYHVWI